MKKNLFHPVKFLFTLSGGHKLGVVFNGVIFLLIPFLVGVRGGSSFAQELNCTIQVLHSQVQTSDKRIFETLRRSIYEFMNNRKWTNDLFETEERIECSMLINISKYRSPDDFEATIQIQSRRTIYNSSYPALLLNFNDNAINFRYLEDEPLEFSATSHLSNLTSILAFYAYIIIGMDYDSFSLEGGTPYFQKAQDIVNNAQSERERGWKAFENTKNRYWLAEDILNQTYRPYRECLYKYHRQGLDIMSENTESSRTIILESIELLEKVHIDKPNSFILQIFFDAKTDELVNIFSGSFPSEKSRVVNLLSKIDPGHINKYQKILKN